MTGNLMVHENPTHPLGSLLMNDLKLSSLSMTDILSQSNFYKVIVLIWLIVMMKNGDSLATTLIKWLVLPSNLINYYGKGKCQKDQIFLQICLRYRD